MSNNTNEETVTPDKVFSVSVNTSGEIVISFKDFIITDHGSTSDIGIEGGLTANASWDRHVVTSIFLSASQYVKVCLSHNNRQTYFNMSAGHSDLYAIP